MKLVGLLCTAIWTKSTPIGTDRIFLLFIIHRPESNSLSRTLICFTLYRLAIISPSPLCSHSVVSPLTSSSLCCPFIVFVSPRHRLPINPLLSLRLLFMICRLVLSLYHLSIFSMSSRRRLSLTPISSLRCLFIFSSSSRHCIFAISLLSLCHLSVISPSVPYCHSVVSVPPYHLCTVSILPLFHLSIISPSSHHDLSVVSMYQCFTRFLPILPDWYNSITLHFMHAVLLPSKSVFSTGINECLARYGYISVFIPSSSIRGDTVLYCY